MCACEITREIPALKIRKYFSTQPSNFSTIAQGGGENFVPFDDFLQVELSVKSILLTPSSSRRITERLPNVRVVVDYVGESKVAVKAHYSGNLCCVVENIMKNANANFSSRLIFQRVFFSCTQKGKLEAMNKEMWKEKFEILSRSFAFCFTSKAHIYHKFSLKPFFLFTPKLSPPPRHSSSFRISSPTPPANDKHLRMKLSWTRATLENLF